MPACLSQLATGGPPCLSQLATGGPPQSGVCPLACLSWPQVDHHSLGCARLLVSAGHRWTTTVWGVPACLSQLATGGPPQSGVCPLACLSRPQVDHHSLGCARLPVSAGHRWTTTVWGVPACLLHAPSQSGFELGRAAVIYCYCCCCRC